MKILVRSGWGDSLSVALRLQDEGHDVRFSIAEPDAKRVGDGLIEKAANLEGSVKWADLVLFDSNHDPLPGEADRVRALGKPTLGSGLINGKLENDRAFAADFARKAGLNVSRTQEFKGPRAFVLARQFMGSRKADEAWVWKPDQVGGHEPPAYTYVSGSRTEMLRMLDYWEGLYKTHEDEPAFVLTPRVEGIEVSTEMWFNGTEGYAFNNTIEKNRFFDGDLGEKTGCSGNVVFGASDRLIEALLTPLKESLRREKYIGPIDINCIIEDETPIFLEFTPRFGYDAIHALSLLIEDMGKLFFEIASGKAWSGQLRDEFAGTVRLHIPPYPLGSPEEGVDRSASVPVFGWDPSKWDPHYFPAEIMLNAKDEPETSGPEGIPMVVGAVGADPRGAIEAAYKNVDKLCIPNMRYRTDLDNSIQKVYDQLVEVGYVEGRKEPLEFTTMLRRGSHGRRY